MSAKDSHITEDDDAFKVLLAAWKNGDREAERQLIELLYPQIHRIAKHQFKSRQASAMQTTEIVNEAFIKLQAAKGLELKDRSHFFALTARVMRHVVVNHFRDETRDKRGGADQLLTIDRFAEVIESPESSVFDWLQVDRLLTDLSGIDFDAAQVVEYRVFADLTIPEVAEVMNTSESTVSRNWQFARLWLLAQLNH
ncbi:ECF-type sigma factor [Marinicella meishanensis]|uniref:ECF-type sigma factor n=1 Tax=Marinicella meishanensis TaxID=2873263 RepID=UPI001CBDA066|nr:ECF-type sigma factor [Marinicella sp. NBU2979]